MEKIALEPLMIETLVDKVLEWEIAFFDKYLDAIGDYTQMFWMGMTGYAVRSDYKPQDFQGDFC